MFCENCGNPLKDTDKFCSGCGQPVQSEAAEQPVSEKPAQEPVKYYDEVPQNPVKKENPYKKHTTAIAVVLGVIGVCVIVALFVVMTVVGHRTTQKLKQDFNHSSYYSGDSDDKTEDDDSDDSSDYFDGKDFNFGSDSDDGGDLGDFF